MIYDDEFRLQVAQEYHKTRNAKATALAFNVTVRSVYRWGKQYADDGENSLKKKPRSPIKNVNRPDEATEQKVVDAWFSIKSRRNFSSTKRKLAEQGVKMSDVTVRAILERRGVIKKKKNRLNRKVRQSKNVSNTSFLDI